MKKKGKSRSGVGSGMGSGGGGLGAGECVHQDESAGLAQKYCRFDTDEGNEDGVKNSKN